MASLIKDKVKRYRENLLYMCSVAQYLISVYMYLMLNTQLDYNRKLRKIYITVNLIKYRPWK